ncbi:hypothetical protein ABS648_07660 [Pseudomonas solani]|uniref:Uncharacterized protein n=1 Tax=Pseudomonas solani TaxID=2731552 RepID=A0AAU7Y9F1_9PSED|nr:hypothetical protein L682_19875 [Pseudomonas alcaligenes OT 69]MDN4149676.1 hypothetical protein [Pseudomonas tohonis]
MTLHDSIVLEIVNGRLNKELRASELLGDERRVELLDGGEKVERYRVGFEFFSESHIATEMANHAEDTGYWVKRGEAPRYRKVERGLYRVLALEEGEELLEDGEAAPLPVSASGHTREERFAHYLAQQPFQIFDRRRRSLHPGQPVQGFTQRLSSYFWPSPSVSYQATEATLNGFIGRARALDANLAANAAAVLVLFQEICDWGGVKLPTQDAALVVHNIDEARKHAASSPAAMSSAWTKLYAIFFPDLYVIYDSRVATALVGIAEAVLDDGELSGFKQQYPALGTVVGRGGSRPRATRSYWKNAYTSWNAQLDANALAAKILTALNQQQGSTHSLRELEAVLFMEGY